MDIPNILETEQYKLFKEFKINTAKLIHSTTNVRRNLNIFEMLVLSKCKIKKTSIAEIIEKYDITRCRIYNIYNKYMISFILFQQYKLHEQDSTTINICKRILSSQPRDRLEQYYIDEKPFKELTERDIHILKLY